MPHRKRLDAGLIVTHSFRQLVVLVTGLLRGVYDSAKRRIKTATQMDQEAALWTSEVQYDAYYGREKVRSYPDGLRVATDYSDYGHVRGLRDPDAGQTYWTLSGQDAWGHPTLESYGNGLSGLHSSYASTGQVKKRYWSGSAGLLDQWDYTYDSFANLTRQTHSYRSGSATVSSGESYAYDSLQRLTQASRSVGGSVSYGYTASGNLDSKSDYSKAQPGAYVYHEGGCGPHFVTGVWLPNGSKATYTCDANGNVTGGNTLYAWYDTASLPRSINRLGVGTAEFLYAPSGERFRQIASGAKTFYGPDGYEKTFDGFGVTTRHELGPVVVTRTYGREAVYAALRDRLGSTVALADRNGYVTERRSYDAFGAVRGADFAPRYGGGLNLSPATRRGFTGHEHLDDVRLIHMNGRAYDYTLGRFLSVDPFLRFPANGFRAPRAARPGRAGRSTWS